MFWVRWLSILCKNSLAARRDGKFQPRKLFNGITLVNIAIITIHTSIHQRFISSFYLPWENSVLQSLIPLFIAFTISSYSIWYYMTTHGYKLTSTGGCSICTAEFWFAISYEASILMFRLFFRFRVISSIMKQGSAAFPFFSLFFKYTFYGKVGFPSVGNGLAPECISALASKIVTVPLLVPMLRDWVLQILIVELFNVKGETYVNYCFSRAICKSLSCSTWAQ